MVSAAVLPDALVGLLQHLVVLLFAQVVIPNRMSLRSRKILVMDLQINLAPMDAKLTIQAAHLSARLVTPTTAATELLLLVVTDALVITLIAHLNVKLVNLLLHLALPTDIVVRLRHLQVCGVVQLFLSAD